MCFDVFVLCLLLIVYVWLKILVGSWWINDGEIVIMVWLYCICEVNCVDVCEWLVVLVVKVYFVFVCCVKICLLKLVKEKWMLGKVVCGEVKCGWGKVEFD